MKIEFARKSAVGVSVREKEGHMNDVVCTHCLGRRIRFQMLNLYNRNQNQHK